jgi:hypothetical protein
MLNVGVLGAVPNAMECNLLFLVLCVGHMHV